MAPKHPIFSGSTFGFISGEKPLFPSQAVGEHEAMGRALELLGLPSEATAGKYTDPERSYIVHGATLAQMMHLGRLFGQESVVHSQNGQHRLVYTNGKNQGKFHVPNEQNPMEHFEQPPGDVYTSIPGHGHVRINFNFDESHELDHATRSDIAAGGSEVARATERASDEATARQKEREAAQPPAASPTLKAEREFTPEFAVFLMKSAVAALIKKESSTG